MEENHVDPYAPPEAATSNTSNTTYLKEDGYAFQNQLVANQYFKSPLICAKLGISIPPESNPVPIEIVVKRVPKFPGFLNYVVFFLSIPIFIFAILTTHMPIFYSVMFALIFALVVANIINRLFFVTPYKIPFYFSEQYTRRRHIRKLIFNTLLLILTALYIVGTLTQNQSALTFSIFSTIISIIIFSFKSTYFNVTETKGDYHYIQGVHKNLLNALPHLPLSS